MTNIVKQLVYLLTGFLTLRVSTNALNLASLQWTSGYL
jgi:hypothetical protein